jgi:hypothetical protein
MQQVAHATDGIPSGPRASFDDEAVGLRTFLDALRPVLVDSPAFHTFDGSIARDHATLIWTWIARDVAPELASRLAVMGEDGQEPGKAFDAVAHDLTRSIDIALTQAGATAKSDTRLTVRMGGDAVRARLPFVVAALRARPAIQKAEEFGRAANGLEDEATIASALKKMPLSDSALIAMMMHAAIGQVANPSRFILAAIRQAGGGTDAALTRAGFGPLVEAMLAHAQSQVAVILGGNAIPRDADLACRAIERYHRLIRAVTGYLEISRENVWSYIVADLTRRISEKLELRLSGVTAEVNLALRRPRDGAGAIDAEDVYSALGGLYILRSVRSCRGSLAVNVVFDRVWGESGRALEVLLARALEDYRDHVHDLVRRERLDAGIKMAEIRFDVEYADIMRRARDGAARFARSTV